MTAHATALAPAQLPLTRAEELARQFVDWYDGNTRIAYEFDLRILFDWCAAEGLDPFEVNRIDLERFVRYLVDDRHNGPESVKRRVSAIKRWYRLAAHDGHIPQSPAEFVRVPHKYVDVRTELDLGLSREEVAALLTTAKAARPVDAALIALLALMGLRVSEACGLTVHDVQHHDSGHRVCKLVGKGGKHATVPIAVPVARLLDAAIGDRTSGPLLVRPGRGPMNRVAAARVVARLAAAAGIDRKVTPHDLRRAYISGCLDAGMPLRDAQTAARHADPRMTARYDRRRYSLDRHGNYALAAFIAGAM